MSIAEILVNDRNKIESFFSGDVDAWLDSYKDSITRIDHDEPWITLISMYALFGELNIRIDQNRIDKIDQNRIDAFNELLRKSGIQNPPIITEILNIKVEKQFKEILSYRKYLHGKAKQNLIFHHYQDRIDKIKQKSVRDKASFEGNTNVDLYIEARAGDKPLYFFIEAKFLSDISYQVSYSPVRDQISRNIDTGIDHVTPHDKKELPDYKSLYFLMLTPRQFRTEIYGGNGNTPLQEFHPERSRLYCYKMNEFKKITTLKEALPHRADLNEPDWKQIAENIGWITYEDIYQQANTNHTMEKGEAVKIWDFFNARNLTEGLLSPY